MDETVSVSYTHLDVYKRQALADPMPSLRGLVVEYGCGIEKIYYKEQKRRTGKSKQTFLSLFNVAICLLYTSRCV